jgi:hypothetical protein
MAHPGGARRAIATPPACLCRRRAASCRGRGTNLQTRLWILLFSTSLLVAMPTCSNKKKVSCAAAADRLLHFMKSDAERAAGTGTDSFAATLGTVRDEVVKRCQQEHWSSEVLACYTAAQSGEDLDGCDRALTAELARTPPPPQPATGQ